MLDLMNDYSAIRIICFLGYIELYCKIQMSSYGFKHSFQPVSDTTLVCTYSQKSKTTDHIWTVDISNDSSTVGQVYFCVLELDAIYNW